MSDAVAEVTQVVHAFAECWNQHDMNAFAELFAPDAEFVNVVGLWWKGRDEIKKAHEFTHATMFKNSRLTITDVSIRFPVASIAIARSRWVLEGHVSPEGRHFPHAPESFSACSFAVREYGGSSTHRIRTSSRTYSHALSKAWAIVNRVMTPNNGLQPTLLRCAPQRG